MIRVVSQSLNIVPRILELNCMQTGESCLGFLWKYPHSMLQCSYRPTDLMIPFTSGGKLNDTDWR